MLGPTGVGKTDYSINLALKYNSPIINCDSRQIFKEMSIGTAAPSKEQLHLVPHYFIHSHSIENYYTAGLYEIEALELLNNLFLNQNTLIMAGGSGMYIDALCNGLDAFPEADLELRDSLMQRLEREGLESLVSELKERDVETYNVIDLNNPQRVVRALEVTLQTGIKFSAWKSSPKKERPFKITKLGLYRDREELYDRINRRVDIMLEEGLVAEVKSLIEYRDRPALKSVGYTEIFNYLDGNISLEDAIDLIKRNSRRYAKRQMTYWNRDTNINWIKL